jgi:hypothetical protein
MNHRSEILRRKSYRKSCALQPYSPTSTILNYYSIIYQYIMFYNFRWDDNFSLGFEGNHVNPDFSGNVGLEKPPYGMLGSSCKYLLFIIRALSFFKCFCRAVGL